MPYHHAVKHPSSLIEPKSGINDRVLDFIADNILPSTILADIALIVPLLAITAPESVKITLGVISGSWIQWWALHILQRSQIKADIKHEAKAKVDHEALTHIANQVDILVSQYKANEEREVEP